MSSDFESPASNFHDKHIRLFLLLFKLVGNMPTIFPLITNTNTVMVEHDIFTEELLGGNMLRLCLERCSQVGPVQQQPASQILDDFNVGTSVFLAGHAARYPRWESDVRIKQEAFYSMCRNSPADSIVVMTFASSDQRNMGLWSPLFRID